MVLVGRCFLLHKSIDELIIETLLVSSSAAQDESYFRSGRYSDSKIVLDTERICTADYNDSWQSSCLTRCLSGQSMTDIN